MTGVFVDTSGFYAFSSAEDQDHQRIGEVFRKLAQDREQLFTSSYVASESMGLIQKRLGWRTLQGFVQSIMPMVEFLWIGVEQHEAGWQLMLRSPSRHFSLVDATAMVVMRQEGLSRCVTLYPEFGRQGFSVLP